MSITVRRPAEAGLKRSRHGILHPPTWRPYPASSFYKPIPASPSIHADSAAIISKVTTPGTPNYIRPGEDSSTGAGITGSSHPLYYATPADPLFTVARHTSSGNNFASDWWNTQIRIPQNALPAEGSDSHLAVVQPDGTEWFIWRVRSDSAGTTQFTESNRLPTGGGTIYGGGFAKHALQGDGIRLFNSVSGSTATAAGWASMLGQIRPAEMNARWIGHALFMNVNRSNGKFVTPAIALGADRRTTLTGQHVFPTGTVTVASTSGFTTTGTIRLPNDSRVAYTGTTGTTFTGCTGGTGTHAGGSTVYEEFWPPMGARFRLNMTASEIDAIADSGNATGRWWNKVLLHAMRVYGMFVGDTGGGNWGVYISSGMEMYSLNGTDPWRVWGAATSPAMTYETTPDFYRWDHKTVVDWATKLQVLDWTDPANY